jgi:hypothetical protein
MCDRLSDTAKRMNEILPEIYNCGFLNERYRSPYYPRKSASIRGSFLSFRVHSRSIFVSIRG